MARLTDLPPVLRAHGAVGFAKRVWREMEEDHTFTWSAALAYSWLFAVFPFLIFLLTLVPLLPAGVQATAMQEVEQALSDALPDDAAHALWANVKPIVDRVVGDMTRDPARRTWVPRLAGLGLALWAASGGMAITMSALDMCYEVDRGRPFYVRRPVAVGVTVAFAGLILCVIALLPVGTIAKAWVLQEYPQTRGSPLYVLFDVTRWALAVLFLLTALGIVYHSGPSIRRQWTWVTPGAVFCVVGWLGLGLLFKAYVTHYGKYGETYGTVGGVVVLLLLFYLDAIVLLAGAQVNSEIDFTVLGVDRGSRDYRSAEANRRGRKAPAASKEAADS